MEKLPNLLNKNQESSWQRASASLDASAKIYGYRVDSVHNETFKFLGGLARADKDEKEQEGDARRERRDRGGKHEGFSTIERDPRKLDLLRFDLEFDVDPLFKSMTAKFNESGARGLLLNNLPLDGKMDLLLESHEESAESEASACSNRRKQEDLSTDIKGIIDIGDLKSTQICKGIDYFKKTRDMETSLERTFYNNMLEEFDVTTNFSGNVLEGIEEINQSDGSLDVDSQIEQDNLSSVSQHISQQGHEMSPDFDNDVNMITIGPDVSNLNKMNYVDNFSYLKSDDIKEYIHQFGDGNKEIFQNIQQYQKFTKSFNQLDKFNVFRGIKSELNNKKEKKQKKEEKLFQFLEDNEPKKFEVFERGSKKKSKKESKNFKKEANKKNKVKLFYRYDKSM